MIASSRFGQLLRDLRSQKLRTFLTASGIVWGTVAVSLLLAFGEGVHRQVYKNSAGIGENIIIAWPSLTSLPFDGLGKGRRIRLREDDIRLIRERVRGLRGISSEYAQGLKLHHAGRALSVDVSGVSPVFGDLRSLVPASGGRFLNAIDEERRRRVIFVGDELAGDLFGEENPVGQSVRLAGSPFLVVGVLRKKAQDSSYSGRDEDKVFMPASTMRVLTGREHVNNFIFKARDVLETERVKREVLQTVAVRHRFDPADKEALKLWDTTEQLQFLTNFMLAFKIFLGAMGTLTLLVGGIGVSNIMSVAVEERTREIGIKMALGARSGTILAQFMLETIVLTAVGGGAGLVVAAAICELFPAANVEQYVGVPAVSPGVAAITAALLGVIGLLAGYFPARDAARLDPVQAMKR